MRVLRRSKPFCCVQRNEGENWQCFTSRAHTHSETQQKSIRGSRQWPWRGRRCAIAHSVLMWNCVRLSLSPSRCVLCIEYSVVDTIRAIRYDTRNRETRRSHTKDAFSGEGSSSQFSAKSISIRWYGPLICTRDQLEPRSSRWTEYSKFYRIPFDSFCGVWRVSIANWIHETRHSDGARCQIDFEAATCSSHRMNT